MRNPDHQNATDDLTVATMWRAFVDVVDGRKMEARWYDVWAAAVAVQSMCVATEGRPGHSVVREGLRISFQRKEVQSNGTLGQPMDGR